MGDKDEEADSPIDWDELIEKTRAWNTYWFWKDRNIAERDAVYEVLTQLGLSVEKLEFRQADPPDCEAKVEGLQWGIEVTELVHEKTLARSIKAIKEREAGREPAKPEAHFVWDRQDFCTAVQQLISRKDAPKSIFGGPYDRYALVIVTDETFLDRNTVSEFLKEAKFTAKTITDAFLGLSYHPSEDGGDGYCPCFRLELSWTS